MSTELSFKLVRPARKSGGDRYEAEVGEPQKMVVYFPQSICRKNGKPVDQLKVRIDLDA